MARCTTQVRILVFALIALAMGAMTLAMSPGFGHLHAVASTSLVGADYRLGGTASGDDSVSVVNQYPWVKVVSLYFHWDQVEATRGSFNWGRVAASFQDAHNRHYALVVRVIAGHYAPTHIYSDSTIAGHGNAAFVDMYPAGGGSRTFRSPVFWDPGYQAEIGRLTNGINTMLSQTFSDGTSFKSVTAGVAVAAASDVGSEMWMGPEFTQSNNAPLWDRLPSIASKIGPDGTHYSTFDQTKAAWEDSAWIAGVNTYATNIPGVPMIIGLGNYWGNTTDAMTVLLGTAPTWTTRLIFIHTNFIPDHSADPPGHQTVIGTWRQSTTREAAELDAALSHGSLIAMQTASLKGVTPHNYNNFANPTAAFTWAMRQDFIPNWSQHAKFLETDSTAFGSNASDLQAAQDAMIAAQGTTPAATTTRLGSSPNPSTAGQSVTLTATVTSSVGTPNGTVTFSDGSSTLGTGTLNSGAASLTTAALSVGSHSLSTTYSGNSTYASSTSTTLTQTVNAAAPAATTTRLASSPNPSTVGQSVTLTATVISSGGTPTGAVTFSDGSATLGTGTLSGSIAKLTTAALIAGSHSLTAAYAGNSTYAASSSNIVVQTVVALSTFTITNLSCQPQPLIKSCTIRFNLSASAHVTIEILNKAGHVVRTRMRAQPLPTGTTSVVFYGYDDSNIRLAVGTYTIQVTAANSAGATVVVSTPVVIGPHG